MSHTPAPRLPGNLNSNRLLSHWLSVGGDGSITITPGKVEIGQGIHTALVQIVADELDVAPSRIRVRAPSTATCANEGVTAGSLSVQDSGGALRQVAAEVRALYVTLAAQRLGVEADSLAVDDGTIVGPGNLRTSYWELADHVPIDREATGVALPKPAAARTVVGRELARIDVPDKTFGRPRFLHDMSLPGLVHGRMLRPPGVFAQLTQVDTEAAATSPGVIAVLRDGNVLGVVAEQEPQAQRALSLLAAHATWTPGEALPAGQDLAAWLRAQPVESNVIDERGPQVPTSTARTIKRSYGRPFIAHASIATSCAIARWTDDRLDVWTHSQGIFNLRADLALLFARPVESIVVTHVEGAGCYGHNAADDAACDAALLARAVPGRPVRVQWSRADELAWGPVGAAAEIEIEADLDAHGDILHWRHDVWSNGHVSRPGRGKTPTLLAGYHIANAFPRQPTMDPPIAGGGGSERNAVPDYELPAWRIRKHRLLTMPLRVSSLRTLGAYANVFARESFMDEVAREKGEDPLAFRLRHLPDPRSRHVLQTAADKAGWTSWSRREGAGHGIAFARYKNTGAYCAVVAEIVVDTDVRVARLICAVDAGEVVNPDGLANQIEGGAIQSTSWTLKEAVQFDATRITSDSWETYPILRFTEVPQVDVIVIDRPDQPSLGAGEASQGPVAAAIGNAVADALGYRVRHLPITRAALVAALG